MMGSVAPSLLRAGRAGDIYLEPASWMATKTMLLQREKEDCQRYHRRFSFLFFRKNAITQQHLWEYNWHYLLPSYTVKIVSQLVASGAISPSIKSPGSKERTYTNKRIFYLSFKAIHFKNIVLFKVLGQGNKNRTTPNRQKKTAKANINKRQQQQQKRVTIIDLYEFLNNYRYS